MTGPGSHRSEAHEFLWRQLRLRRRPPCLPLLCQIRHSPIRCVLGLWLRNSISATLIKNCWRHYAIISTGILWCHDRS
jgi:hypothetical protein